MTDLEKLKIQIANKACTVCKNIKNLKLCYKCYLSGNLKHWKLRKDKEKELKRCERIHKKYGVVGTHENLNDILFKPPE